MPDLLRADVSGVAIYVRSDFERRFLERTNSQLACMKMALHKIARQAPDHCPGDCMEDAYAHLRAIAVSALEEIRS